MKNVLFVILLLIISVPMNAQNNPCNCCTENHNEFDFWIGKWIVTNLDGSIAGDSIISKMQNNCMINESWTSATAGYSGTSSNFYNTKTGQWEQIWIDNQGGVLLLKGNRVGNQMILKTDIEKNEDGADFYHRIIWTANSDGTVRQYWETFIDGKDVTVAFDGLYKKQ